MYTIEQLRKEQLKLQQRRVIEAGKDYVKGLFTPLGKDKATREIDFDEGAKWMFLNQWISVEDECPIGTCVLLDKYGNMRLDRLQWRALGYIQNLNITHWMPIPNLPEGGAQ